ncbi:MAG TPA: hypothetical protein VF173_18385 [Thermoanaerobaculia bacterium]|nr:hypothetical protein [Thermoanaerobaculia bacterium]
MNDFLGRLAARVQGEAAMVKPRVRSRYEPGEAGVAGEPPRAGEVWGEEVAAAAGGEDVEDGRDGRDSRDGRGRTEEAGERAAVVAAPLERRVAPPLPAMAAVEPREARLTRKAPVVEVVEAAAQPAPAPIPVAARPRPVEAARKAAGETVAAPPEVPAAAAPLPAAAPAPAPGPRRSEPRISPRISLTPEPGPRPERPAGEAGPAAAPAPPEPRPSVRVSRPAGRPAEPLPTVGPRREVAVAATAREAREPQDAEDVVRVSIGRIDVHAGPPPVQAPTPRRPAAPRLSLSDYLKGRSERRRR